MIRLIFLLCSFLMLSACSVFHPAPPVYTNPDLPQKWEAEGKAALRSANRGLHVYFTWQQDGDSYRIIVRGPLGLGRAELSGKPGEVSVQSDRLKEELKSDTLENLLETATGRRAPISHALHWLKAEAATPHARVSRHANGKLERLKEDGWTVNYLEWSTEAPNLPRRLTIEGPDGKATVVIGLWRLNIEQEPETAPETPASDTAATSPSTP
jgi:outer membrane lipoprotein LolB